MGSTGRKGAWKFANGKVYKKSDGGHFKRQADLEDEPADEGDDEPGDDDVVDDGEVLGLADLPDADAE